MIAILLEVQRVGPGGRVVSLLLFVIFVALVVWLAVMWSKAKTRADRAEAELSSFKEAYAQLMATKPTQSVDRPSPPAALGPPASPPTTAPPPWPRSTSGNS